MFIKRSSVRPAAFTVALVVGLALPTAAQVPSSLLKPGSDHIEILGDRPLGAGQSVPDLDIEQELSRPYVFVSGYLDGLQIFSLMDPENPVTVGYCDTYPGAPSQRGMPDISSAQKWDAPPRRPISEDQ